jgi:hypothetical protein
MGVENDGQQRVVKVPGSGEIGRCRLAAVLHRYWRTGQTQRRAKQWVNQAAIDVDNLKSFRIPLPPLNEQYRIMEILQEAEEIRRLRAEAESKTAELIPAIFAAIFGDLYFGKSPFPVQLLSSIGELDRGKSKHRPRDEASLYGGPYPFIQIFRQAKLPKRAVGLQPTPRLIQKKALSKAGFGQRAHSQLRLRQIGMVRTLSPRIF